MASATSCPAAQKRRTPSARCARAARLALLAAAVATTAACGGGGGGGTSGGAPRTLASIDVAPATTTVPVGRTVHFAATGHYSDGSTQDLTADATWSSSDASRATISSAAGSKGVATGVAAGGPVSIKAHVGAVLSAAASLTVGPAVLDSVEVSSSPSPASVPKGLTVAFTATGHLSDGTTEDVTTTATWSTLDGSVATAAGNVVTGEGVGVTDVLATAQGVTGSAQLTVTPAVVQAVSLDPPAASVAVGTSVQLAATAFYSDGSRQDRTGAAAWTVDAGGHATVTGPGIVTGVSAGAATITATVDAVPGSAPLTVTSATLTSLVVTPATPRLALGIQEQFLATGVFSDHTTQDLTSQVTWSSSAPGVATIAPSGVATPVAVGTTAVGASITAPVVGLRTGSTILTVTNAVLRSVAVTPPSATFAAGTSQQYRATATYSDYSTQDVTGTASWTSSAPAVAAAAPGGTVTGVAAGGPVTVTATLAGVPGTAQATVTAASLQALAVTPSGASLPAGVQQQLTATGSFSDGSAQDLTAAATWASSVPSVAAVSNVAPGVGVVTALGAGATAISAGVGGVAAVPVPLTVTAATLASIQVDPAGVTTVPLGRSVQYVATGTWTDSTQRDLTAAVTWTSGNPAVATLSNAVGSEGLAKGVAAGSAAIGAALGGVSSSTPATLSVTAPVLEAVHVYPASASVAKGLTQTFTATGVYSDGTVQDLTGTASWDTLDHGVALASGSLVHCTGEGVTQVVAVVGGFPPVHADLTVTPPVVLAVSLSPTAPTIAAGTTVQYGAIAVLSDGTKTDVTPSAAWAATPETVATVTGGLVRGLVVGNAVVSATAEGVTAQDPLTVTSALLQTISLAPTGPSVPMGYPVQFTATGIFTDGNGQDLTTQVTWSSSAPSVATVSASGLADPLAIGSTSVGATLGAVTATPTVLTVTPATLTGIAVDQASATVSSGTSVQLTATGTYSDLSTQDVTALATWTSDSGAVASVSDAAGTKGLVVGAAPGATHVNAALGGFTDFAPVTVTSATLVSMTVTPPSTSLPSGATQQLTARGTFSDGSTQDLTAAAGWTSSVSTVAAVSNAPGQEGLVTALAAGDTAVTAAYHGMSGSAAVTVTGATLAWLEVTPLSTTVPVKYARPFKATAHFSDGTSRDVTTQATWASTATTVATISNTAPNQGIATGVAAGVTTIRATLWGATGTASLTVTNATLATVTVAPSPFTVAKGATLQLAATGHFSDGSALDLTAQLAWSTSNRKRATVSKGGLVTGTGAGTVTITARKPGGTSGTASGTVTP